MAAKQSIIIRAIKDKKSQGYVKFINYDNAELHLTNDKEMAKKYDNEDSVQSDIDFLSKYYFESGYVFTY